MSLLTARHYQLQNFQRSNQDTCLVNKPARFEGEWVQPGDLLADCSSSVSGELSLGQNLLIAYMPWEGYNYEDAILISERLVYDDLYTSIHIEKYEIETTMTKYGYEEITKNIPDVSKEALENLDEQGIIKNGSLVFEGDILVGKVTPIEKKFKSPYQKLLYNILEKELASVRDSSLRAPKGLRAKVMDRKIFEKKHPTARNTLNASSAAKTEARPAQNPKMIHLYLAEKRRIQVGDKMAGRHGNKGIISKILPIQDMPYLPDGSPIDMVLNPLGVPSRMNVGQIYECLLGLASKYLGQSFRVRVFDEMYGSEASRSLTFFSLYEARLKTGHRWLFNPKSPGKMKIYDGRTGLPFHQTVTVGVSYMLKLVHLVDDKIHCLTPDHEVFTSSGWVKIPKLGMQHKLATLDSSGLVCFQKPTRIHQGNYHGLLYVIQNTHVDLRVTLDHRMLVRSSNLKKTRFSHYEFKPAYTVKGKNVEYLRSFHRPDRREVGFSLKEKVSNLKNPMFRFLAFYLAMRAKFSQVFLDFSFKKTFSYPSTMGFSEVENARDFYVSFVWFENLMQLTFQVGVIAEQIWKKTKSPISLQVSSELEASRLNPLPFFKEDLFRIPNEYEDSREKHYEGFVPYNGPVYCVTVPNEKFYVRRNGLSVWTGNSRSTGPYSLVSQQPLRGRSKFGGQRLGEMEVWALEGYGSAFTLLEMLTIKSDDITGRMTLWSNLILHNPVYIGTPESFKVLVCELQALCLDIGLFKFSEKSEKKYASSLTSVSPFLGFS